MPCRLLSSEGHGWSPPGATSWRVDHSRRLPEASPPELRSAQDEQALNVVAALVVMLICPQVSFSVTFRVVPQFPPVEPNLQQ
jgi:hypothetical protein